MMQHIKKICLLFTALCISPFVFGHNVNLALEKAPVQDIIRYYTKLGIEHIIPLGVDHILFIVALCLLSVKLKTIVWQATAFTVAHSITLALSMRDVITLPSEVVEPIIALSIVFIAVENIMVRELKAWRIGIVFLFGLIHGLGFASVLNEIGLPPNKFFTSIFSFNLGVEIGQIAIILLVFLFLIVPFGKKPWYKKRVVYSLSGLIGLIALYWTFERVI